MTDRSGVEIDYCPTCRGVWLDRGELDKLIERSEQSAPARTQQPAQSAPATRESYDRDEYQAKPHHKKRRESFLGDLFDF